MILFILICLAYVAFAGLTYTMNDILYINSPKDILEIPIFFLVLFFPGHLFWYICLTICWFLYNVKIPRIFTLKLSDFEIKRRK